MIRERFGSPSLLFPKTGLRFWQPKLRPVPGTPSASAADLNLPVYALLFYTRDMHVRHCPEAEGLKFPTCRTFIRFPVPLLHEMSLQTMSCPWQLMRAAFYGCETFW